MISPQRRKEIIDSLRRGTVPQRGLDAFAVGLERFEAALDEELAGVEGMQRLPPLAQRLNVDFATDPRFDNPRAVQIRLPNFDLLKLGQVGRNIRDLFIQGSASQERLKRLADKISWSCCLFSPLPPCSLFSMVARRSGAFINTPSLQRIHLLPR